MNDRTDTAVKAEGGSEVEATSRTASSPGRPAAPQAATQPVTPAAPPAVPAIGDFLATEETRLRDLLAYGMASAAGRVGPDGIEGLRRKAEADLEAHAFRVLHNQVEVIRRQAMDEQSARMPRGASFGGAVLANLVALALAGAMAVGAVWLLAPGLFARLLQALSQLIAKV
jgi:hypothetical protein